MSDAPAGLAPSGYQIQNLEIRPDMVVVSFAEVDGLANPIQDHTTRVIPAGVDPDVDAKVREIMDDISELLDLAHRARRRPPDTLPGRRA